MTTDPQLTSKIAEWRSRAAAGTLSIEDMKQAVRDLRGQRTSAATASEQARRTKAKKVIKSSDDLLNELEGL